MSKDNQWLAESTNHAKSARAILLAKYNTAWIGNEHLVNIKELSLVDGELFKSLNALINEQKEQLSKKTKRS
ncbi:hypothetical protein [uncultured Pseudoalteromonas sp.]|uniref:hypothetical protein n=1 Tax=uncultured Pseudoalteromonas sp. TaxID=114053 RepID=UPI0025992155|nr:hypothetical protein [uncultured Pseudoalteromonas sp.]